VTWPTTVTRKMGVWPCCSIGDDTRPGELSLTRTASDGTKSGIATGASKRTYTIRAGRGGASASGRAGSCHNGGVDPSPDDRLADQQRAWAVHSEALWARARAIAKAHPDVDAGDVYHALRCLELPPAARLRQALSRGRLRAYQR
jgi:hypothetical protein